MKSFDADSSFDILVSGTEENWCLKTIFFQAIL